MSKRFSALFVSCIVLCLVPQMSHGQETDDTRAIRSMLTADQNAWRIGDGKQVLSHMDEHYTVFHAPTLNGELDFNGIEVAATPDDFREMLLDPEWTGHPGGSSARARGPKQRCRDLDRVGYSIRSAKSSQRWSSGYHLPSCSHGR